MFTNYFRNQKKIREGNLKFEISEGEITTELLYNTGPPLLFSNFRFRKWKLFSDDPPQSWLKLSNKKKRSLIPFFLSNSMRLPFLFCKLSFLFYFIWFFLIQNIHMKFQKKILNCSQWFLYNSLKIYPTFKGLFTYSTLFSFFWSFGSIKSSSSTRKYRSNHKMQRWS